MITSASNSKIKYVCELRDSGRARRRDKCFIAEGLRMFTETPEDMIKECYVTEGFLSSPDERVKSKLENIKYETVSDRVFEKMSGTVTPQGVMAVVKYKGHEPADIISGGGTVLLLENIQDPGNLGTMLRTAEAAGVKGILLSHGSADIYSPKVIRSTMGAIYRMPFAYGDIYDMMDDLKKAGFKIHAAALGYDSDYRDADYTGDTALLIGNEGNGLTKRAIESSTDTVTIPMDGQAESLNAAVSAALLMYEARRSRE